MSKIRLAIITSYGMCTGGTEKFLQTVASNLPVEKYEVSYYYIDSDKSRVSQQKMDMLIAKNVHLIPYQCDGCVTKRNCIYQINSNFFEKFTGEHDIILTGSCGLPEYPMSRIKTIPIIESIHYVSGIDNSYNIARILHISQFSRQAWIQKGGDPSRIIQISHPIFIPEFNKIDYRREFGLSENTVIYGMHQRNDDYIFSEVPLKAYSKIENDSNAFLLLGGSNKYREQARALGLKNCFFLDSTDQNDIIYSFLNTIDVYTHGRYDGELNSTALAEAMAFSLPIISVPSHRFNGHLEVIKSNGIIANTVDEYADAMEIMMDETKRNELGRASLEMFTQHYELNGQMEHLMSIFESVVNNPYPNRTRRRVLGAISEIKKSVKDLLYHLGL